jgi:hypothetical protein
MRIVHSFGIVIVDEQKKKVTTALPGEIKTLPVIHGLRFVYKGDSSFSLLRRIYCHNAHWWRAIKKKCSLYAVAYYTTGAHSWPSVSQKHN